MAGGIFGRSNGMGSLGSWDGVFKARPVPSLRGFGEVAVPGDCWDQHGFKASSDAIFRDAQTRCSMGDGTYDEQCMKSWVDGNMENLVKDCKTALATVPAGACTSKPVVTAVQAAIGTDADGNWGPKSQAALAKTGKSFKDFAPSCTGSVPGASTGGGGTSVNVGGGTSAPPPASQPPPPAAGFKFADLYEGELFGLPKVVFLGLGAILVAVGVKKMMDKRDGYEGSLTHEIGGW